MSAHDLSDGGLAQALAECVTRFGIGARVWLDEIVERDGVDLTSALFSESTARAIVTVPREDDVKFVGLCEARGFPVLRIGVTDRRGPEAELTIQDVFTVPVAESRPPRPSSVRTLLIGLNTAPGQPAGRLERSSKLTGMAASNARDTISPPTSKSR